MTTQVQTAQNQEKFVIKIDKNLAKIIDSDTRKKLTDAYLKLFSGFAWVNWTNKQSLGRAWHNALGQCEGFIKTKKTSTPVTKYMKRTYDAHKKYWSRIIMTNQNSQNTLNKPENEAKQIRAYGIKQIREAMGIINLIYEQFKQYEIEFAVDKTSVKTAEVSKTQSNTPQSQPVAKAVEQAMPAVQKNVAQLQQQTAQPHVQAIAKPQQIIQPAQQTQQAQAKAQEQVKPAVQAQPVAQAQEQVKPQQVPKTVQWQYAQIKLQQQVHAIAKPQQVKQPIAKVPEQVKPQQVKQPEQKITSLKPVQEAQIKQQQIRMFMFAKYNQRTA